MLCDVLQERDIQLQLRIKKQEQEKQIEKHWEQVEVAKAEAHDEKMKDKMRREFDRIIQQRKNLKDQLQEVKMKVIKNYQEEELEGEMLKRLAQQDLEEKRNKDLQKKRQEVENA